MATSTVNHSSTLTPRQRETLYVWAVLTSRTDQLDSASFNKPKFIASLGTLNSIDPSALESLIDAVITKHAAFSDTRGVFQDLGVKAAATNGPGTGPVWGNDGTHPTVPELRSTFSLSPLTSAQLALQPQSAR